MTLRNIEGEGEGTHLHGVSPKPLGIRGELLGGGGTTPCDAVVKSGWTLVTLPKNKNKNTIRLTCEELIQTGM